MMENKNLIIECTILFLIIYFGLGVSKIVKGSSSSLHTVEC